MTLLLFLDSFSSVSSPQKIACQLHVKKLHVIACHLQMTDYVMLLCSDKQLDPLFLSGKELGRLYTKAISILRVLPGPAGRELSVLALGYDKHCKGRRKNNFLFCFVLFLDIRSRPGSENAWNPFKKYNNYNNLE